MGKLFDPDGRVMSVLTMISEFCILNILWVIGCIPVVTAGASTAAMFRVTMRIAEQKDIKIAAVFLASFRECFRRATGIGMLMLATGILVAGDVYLAFFSGLGGPLILALMPVSVLLTALWLMEFLWVFPLLGYSDLGARATMRSAMIAALAHLPRTALMLAALALCGYITFRVPAVIPVWVFVGAAMAAYGITLAFRVVIPTSDGEKKEQ